MIIFCYFHIVKNHTKQLRQFIVIICAIGLVSCNYFFSKQTPQKTNNIDTVIDFTKVDAFPLFPECKNIPSRDKQKICFQIKMAEHIQALLKNSNFKTQTAQNDTLLVSLKVLQSGKTQFVLVKSKNNNKTYANILDSILRQQASNIPILQPAIKRGIPVTTQFELPIIIKN